MLILSPQVPVCTDLLTVGDNTVHVDYAGSSPQVPWGINVMPHYRYAHSAYAIKCLLDPDTPNNEGCIRPITDTAPLGSLVNPRWPARRGGRSGGRRPAAGRSFRAAPAGPWRPRFPRLAGIS